MRCRSNRGKGHERQCWPVHRFTYTPRICHLSALMRDSAGGLKTGRDDEMFLVILCPPSLPLEAAFIARITSDRSPRRIPKGLAPVPRGVDGRRRCGSSLEHPVDGGSETPRTHTLWKPVKSLLGRTAEGLELSRLLIAGKSRPSNLIAEFRTRGAR